MLIKSLIDQLQALYDEEIKHVDAMGQPEIMIDVFKKDVNTRKFEYKGFSHNIVIQRSSDGVYPIITAMETWE